MSLPMLDPASPSRVRVALTVPAVAVVLFLWHSIVWAVPAHQAAFEHRVIPSELARSLDPPSGSQTYFLDEGRGDGDAPLGTWGWATAHRQEDYAIGRYVGGSLVLQLLTAIVVVLLVRRVRARGAFLALFGVAVLNGPFWYWNWSWFSTRYALTMAFDLGVGLALAVGLATLLLRDRAKSEASDDERSRERSVPSAG